MALLPALLVWFAATALAAPQSPQVQTGHASLAGVVLRADTGEPVAGARVIAAGDGQDGGWLLSGSSRALPPAFLLQTTTDSEGRFLFDDLAPGTYFIAAERSGFVRQLYGARGPGRPGAPVTVAAGAAAPALALYLSPGAVLSGRVTNEQNEPLAGLTVSAMRTAYGADGNRTLRVVERSLTNDRGEYRAYSLAPGRYAVLVDPVRSDNERVAAAGYAATYFPGLPDAAAAFAVDVAAGSETPGVDIVLRSQPVFRVRARLPSDTTTIAPDLAWLTAEGASPVERARDGLVADGFVAFRNVPPGAYTIHVHSGEVPRYVGHVDVAQADVDEVILIPEVTFQVDGHVRQDVTGSSTSASSPLWLTLMPLDELGAERSATPDPDGTLRFVRVPPGRYRLTAARLPPGSYLQSARLDGADALTEVTIAGTGILDVVVSRRAAQIEGTVLDRRQRAVAGVEVVLLPVREADRTSGRVLTTVTDGRGQFVVSSVPPGDYRMFAWDDLEPFQFFDATFVRPFEGQGTAVHVIEDGRHRVQLRILAVR